MRGVKAVPKQRSAARSTTAKNATAKNAAAKNAAAKNAAARKPAAKKAAVTKAAAKPPAARRAAAKPPAAKKAAATKPAATKPAAARRPGTRADLGAPIDGFFRRQPQQLRPILEALRAVIEQAVPEAASSIKWGMPFFTLDGEMMCALGSHKTHVNLILSGPPGAFDDPDGRLEGTGKTGRHLKLTHLDELPRAAVRGWLRTAAEHARAQR
jgi:hypothetical protein